MKRKWMVGVLILFLIGNFAFGAEAAEPQTKATWLWNPWMINNDEAGTLDFLVSKDVNKVYLQIDPDIPSSVYQSFNAKAAEKGIDILALDGAPDWVAPKGEAKQTKLMAWLADYQKNSTNPQQFKGIHLDVEPYLYSGWKMNQAKTITSFQSLLVKAKNSAAALGLPLEADLPFWFDEISYKNTHGKGVLAEWVIAKTDGVTLMAYRDTAPMIIEIVKNEVAYAKKHGKLIIIGVETGYTDEGNRVSFYEEGEAYMNGQLTLVQIHYSGAGGFGGIAVHHVDSWKQLKP
ncbi:MAG TPA: amidase [Planococcus sp. (in: firmicutes)]|nr:amidase [Planococcus sp. (in: firmicutes)]